MKQYAGFVRRCLVWAIACALLLAPITAAAASESTNNTKLKLRIMETTDIHMNLVNYDYYRDSLTDEFGLAKTASLIKKYRKEAANSLLFDNGDLIQGNPLGDVVAKVKPLQEGETHPAYKAMNLLDYDAGNIGNHEFNYGLDFLELSLKGAAFPYVNANVYIDDKDDNPANDQNYFTPYVLLDRTFVDENGQDQAMKIGVIGFVPPQIMQWDKANLEGKVIAKGIVETANKFVPKMKAEGADLVIAIPHSGFGLIEDGKMAENSTYLLSKVPGIDAILFGHAHVVFPDENFAGPPGVDLAAAGVDMKKGTINGVPAVEPGFWGDHLGIIDLELERVDGKWKVVDSQSAVIPIYDKSEKTALVDADPAIVKAVQQDHEAALDYVRGSVGKTSAPINSYFALIQDDPSVQLVTNAQKWYLETAVQGTEYEGIPILSAGAPFKAGGRGGASYYTDIPAGDLAVKNMADLYVYPNTLSAVLVTGADVKEWLERAAGQFNQIDPKRSEEQDLINSAFPTYNFDIIDGVTYRIDVTQPSRYSLTGELEHPEANRVLDLRYNGKPIEAEQQFLIATNNYRAGGGGNFPGSDGSTVVISSPDENRQIIIDYIREHGTINPSADQNWSLAPIDGDVNVTFLTSPDAERFAAAYDYMALIGVDKETGFAKYGLKMDSFKPVASTEPKSSEPVEPTAPGEPEAPVEPAAPVEPSVPVVQDEVYIVKAGDVLSRIALKYGMDWRDLAAYNKLKNPHLIYIGQKIYIPRSK